MGAALHLAHAHQPPPGPKRKRKGGGRGGDGYDALVERVYRDPRMTSESRELILLIAWLIKKDPQRHDADGKHVSTWTRAGNVLGNYQFGRREKPRLADLINADRPRYEPDRSGEAWHHVCRAPMIRRDGECGQRSTDQTLKVDPATGWWTPVAYCRRHADWGRRVEAAHRAAERVEPIPNCGGLMPAYVALKSGDDGWKRLYGWASTWTYSGWEPPVRYGLTRTRGRCRARSPSRSLCGCGWPLSTAN